MPRNDAASSADVQWWEDHVRVVETARILVALDIFTCPEEVIGFFENPQASSGEHDLWVAAGRPHPACPDDLAEARVLGRGPRAEALRQKYDEDTARWSAFCDVMDAHLSGGAPLAAVR